MLVFLSACSVKTKLRTIPVSGCTENRGSADTIKEDEEEEEDYWTRD